MPLSAYLVALVGGLVPLNPNHFEAFGNDVDVRSVEVFADGTNLTDQVGRVHTSFLKDNVVLPGRGVAAGVRVFF